MPAYAVNKATGIAYGPDPAHRLDSYRPAGLSGKLPTIMMITGGAWYTANRDSLDGRCRQMAALGYTCFTMSYRVVPAGFTYPAQIDDLKRALDWANTTNYVNGARMMAWGWSAGSFAAANLVANAKKIKCAMLECAPLDLGDGSDPVVAAMLGGADPQVASPINMIDAESRPSMVVYGTADTLTPPGQGLNWKARYDALSRPCAYREHSGGHGGFPAGVEWDQVFAEQVAWVAANL